MGFKLLHCGVIISSLDIWILVGLALDARIQQRCGLFMDNGTNLHCGFLTYQLRIFKLNFFSFQEKIIPVNFMHLNSGTCMSKPVG